MPKELIVILNDLEYEILKKMRVVEGEDGEKLKKIFSGFMFQRYRN